MIKRNILIEGDKTYKDISDDICQPLESFPGIKWFQLFGLAITVLLFYVCVLGYIAWTGMGTMGVNHPIGWGTDIVTFVFWIGIGHLGHNTQIRSVPRMRILLLDVQDGFLCGR